MFFDEKIVQQEHLNGKMLIPKVEKTVDVICEKGYQNIFYIGIGGTALLASQMQNIVKQLGAKLPLYVENAADFCLVGNPYFSQNSIVVIESVSGDTKEMIQAVDKVHELGASVLGYVEKQNSPLYEKVDYLISSTGCAQYFWYTVTFRFLKNADMYPEYDNFIENIKNLSENAVSIFQQADSKAQEYTLHHWNEPLQYLIASGNLEAWAHCYGMCTLEEMQWMKTRPLSASDFFHGTLEVIERDTCIMLMKGEDITRPLMERVENFVNKISANVTVFDTKDFELNGVEEKYRGLLSPIIVRTAFKRISLYLEYYRRHPLDIRRYYRHLEY